LKLDSKLTIYIGHTPIIVDMLLHAEGLEISDVWMTSQKDVQSRKFETGVKEAVRKLLSSSLIWTLLTTSKIFSLKIE
jgi:hypothetical protein